MPGKNMPLPSFGGDAVVVDQTFEDVDVLSGLFQFFFDHGESVADSGTESAGLCNDDPAL